MTINEAIETADRRRPNAYGAEVKLRWLSALDGMIWEELFRPRADGPLPPFPGYVGASPDTPLLIGPPYDEDVYNYFLQSRIDAENGEMARYNQSVTLFNSAFRLYQNWYNRTHAAPAGHDFRF